MCVSLCCSSCGICVALSLCAESERVSRRAHRQGSGLGNNKGRTSVERNGSANVVIAFTDSCGAMSFNEDHVKDKAMDVEDIHTP